MLTKAIEWKVSRHTRDKKALRDITYVKAETQELAVTYALARFGMHGKFARQLLQASPMPTNEVQRAN